MKKQYITLIAFVLTTLFPLFTIFAQAPQKIDFQAIARSSGGEPLAEQNIGVKISILSGLVTDSIVVYEEEYSILTDEFGLFNLEIGEGNPETFAEIDWGNGSYSAQVGIDPTGLTGYTNMGTMEMVSVPYALHARNTDSWSIFDDKTYTLKHVGIGTTEPIDKLDVHGDYGWHAPDNFKLRGEENENEFSFDFEDGDGNDRWHVWDPENLSILTIRNNGRVGIGTSSPDVPLHIYRASTIGGITDPDPTNGVLHVEDNSHNMYMDGNSIILDADSYISTTGEYDLYFGTNNSTRIRILGENGNVGIGTNSPDAKLEVSGGETILEQESWNAPTLQNGWENYGGSYSPAGYFKDSNGIVHLRGLVRNGIEDVVIFSLPSGYRPAYKKVIAAHTYGSSLVGRIDIYPNGNVIMNFGDNGWISLDGITFRAE